MSAKRNQEEIQNLVERRNSHLMQFLRRKKSGKLSKAKAEWILIQNVSRRKCNEYFDTMIDAEKIEIFANNGEKHFRWIGDQEKVDPILQKIRDDVGDQNWGKK